MITPSLPTLSMAFAIMSPMSLSPLAESVPTCATSALVEILLVRVSKSATTASIAKSIPLFKSIGLRPAATAFEPSLTIA